MAEKENLKKAINAVLIAGGIFGAVKTVAEGMSKAGCAGGEKPCAEIKDDFAGMQDKKRAYETAFKPLEDSVLPPAGLHVFLPAFLIISIAVHTDDPEPAFFAQGCIGKK